MTDWQMVALIDIIIASGSIAHGGGNLISLLLIVVAFIFVFFPPSTGTPSKK